VLAQIESWLNRSGVRIWWVANKNITIVSKTGSNVYTQLHDIEWNTSRIEVKPAYSQFWRVLLFSALHFAYRVTCRIYKSYAYIHIGIDISYMYHLLLLCNKFNGRNYIFLKTNSSFLKFLKFLDTIFHINLIQSEWNMCD